LWETETEPEMSQEEQAGLLVEPSFTNRLDDEDALLEAEFGPPDAAGYYGRGTADTVDTEAPESAEDPAQGGAA
jgi:hypothetical protein